jgi:alpha-1,6-mannosyltransferase
VPAALAAYAVPAVLTGHGLGFLNGLGRTDDSTQWTSVPTALGMTVGYALRLFGVDGADQAVLVARAVGVAAGAAAAGVLWVWAWRADGVRTRVWAAGAAFGVAAVLGPVFYPWYALTPLALLAVSTVAERSREWLGVGAAGLSFLVLPNGTGLAPRTKLPGALTVTAATLALARRWLRRRRPVPAGPTTSRGPAS